VLLDHVGATCDADIAVCRDRARLAQRALDAVVDEVKRRATGPHPGLSDLRGEHEHRRVKRRFFGPHRFAQLEHALAHDADAGALERLLEDLIVSAGLAAFAELQILAEKTLREDPAVELAPLRPPILEARIAGVGQVHAGRYEISVEGDADAE